MPVASCVATGTACGRHPVASLLSMPVASCVATGTACGRHSVASLLSMPVASCVATGTACGRHPVASLLSMPVASCVATGTACGRHSVASLLSMREGFPPKLPLHQPAFPACVPKRGTGFFCCGHPRTEERSQKARPLRPCSDTAGCRACGTLCVHGYAAFPWSDRPQPLHPPQAPATMLSRLPARPRQRTTTAPLPEDGTAIRNRINVLGRGELTGW